MATTETMVDGDGDVFAGEKRRGRRKLVAVIVIGALFLGWGARASALAGVADTGDAILADLLSNSFKELAQGAEIRREAQRAANIARDAADLAQRTANTAMALQHASAAGVVDRFKGNMLVAYPEFQGAYNSIAGIGKNQGILDWSLTYCAADAIRQEKVTDPLTGATTSRGEWCRRYKQSGDGRMMYAAYEQLAGAPVEAQLSALEAQRRRLLYEEDLYQFRLCIQRNIAFCAEYACRAGPAAWANSSNVARLPCQRVPEPGKPMPSPAVLYGLESGGEHAPCPNPFPSVVGSSAQDQQNMRKMVCESEMQAAQLGDMRMRAEGEQAASRQRQLGQLSELIADTKLKADTAKGLARQADATVRGADALEKQLQVGGRIEASDGPANDRAMHLGKDR